MTAQLDCIGLVVSDMARTLAFYRELGVEIPDGADNEGHVEAKLPGGVRLLFDSVETVRSFDPDWQPPSGGNPKMGFAFKCDSPAEVDAVYSRLVDLGYDGHKEPWDAFWGQRYALVRDPEGNSADLFAPLS